MPRYSSEQRQEDVSRAQLTERLTAVGWKVDTIGRDVGEDLQCRIFQDGESTGLGFDIQIKSVTDIEKIKRKKDGVIVYDLDVSDLLHWEVSVQPTIFIVWDVNQKYGVWLSIVDVISKLDVKDVKWRTQKTKSVEFSEDQNTHDNGLTLLRMSLLKESEGALQRWAFRNFSFDFPADEEAQPALQEFLKARKTGEAIELDGKYIKFSERDQRLLGPLLDWEWKVTMGGHVSEEVFPISLQVETKSGERLQVPYIEMRMTSRGTEQIAFTNFHKATSKLPERKGTPLCFEITYGLQGDDFGLNFTIEDSYPTAHEIKKTIPFLNALAEGVRLSISFLKHAPGKKEEWEEIPPQKIELSVGFSQLIDKICELSEITGCDFYLPDWNISLLDELNAQFALELLSKGQALLHQGTIHHVNLNRRKLKSSPKLLNQLLKDLETKSFQFSSQTGFEEQNIVVLGVQFPLGRCSMQQKGYIGWTAEQIREAIKAEKEDFISVPIVDAETLIEREEKPTIDASGQVSAK